MLWVSVRLDMGFMNTDQRLKFSTTSSEQSLVFGEKLASNIEAGQLIEFIGDLGGGKTTIIKGIARGLGIKKTLTSPTFNITRSYEIPNGNHLEHYDLYRLDHDETIRRELTEVMADPTAIVVIEWAKPFIRKIAEDYLIIKLSYIDETTRSIELTATGKKSQAIIEALR